MTIWALALLPTLAAPPLRLEQVWEGLFPPGTWVTVDGNSLLLHPSLYQLNGPAYDPKTGAPDPAKGPDINAQFGKAGSGFSHSDWPTSVEVPLFSSKSLSLVALTTASQDYISLLERGQVESRLNESVALPTQPIALQGPLWAYGRTADKHFFIRSISSQSDRGEFYYSALLLDPLRVSPLRFIRYHDSSNPQRALGWFIPDYWEFQKVNFSGSLIGWVLGCGDLFTGKIHWKLSDQYSWAGRVGDKILARRRTEAGEWWFLDEQTGKPTRVPKQIETLLSSNKKTLRNMQFGAVDGYLLLWGGNPGTSDLALKSFTLRSEQ